MKESFFGNRAPADVQSALRQSIGRTDGRYLFFKVRRYGKLHFEKRVAPAFVDDLVTVEALRKEFEIGYGLDHPGVVRYMAYEGNAVFEEYVDGLTLRQMIDAGDKRLKDCSFLRDLCRQLLLALDYLHGRGILHLDLKPENVMVCNIGNGAKIIDFGSARSAEFDSTEGYTPEYMAPEQANGLATGITTDIYLLGKLMEELSRGESDGSWREFIAMATSTDPAQRFANCSQAIAALPVADASPSKQKSLYFGWLILAAIVGIVLWFAASENKGGLKAPAKPALTEYEQAANLLRGKGVEQDEAEGMRLMMLAAEKGNADAQCYIGLMYRDGTATLHIDPAESYKWIKRAADQGHEIAVEELGYKYYEGFGVEQNYVEAMKWLKKAAAMGKPTAYASIGIMYRDGEGVDPDSAKAEEYFQKGATAGNSYSAYLLGRLYTKTDPSKAVEWFKKASDMGSHRATEVLRDCYRNGSPDLGIAPDKHLATKYAGRLESADGQ